MFTDIVGSTELTTTLGDEAWLAILRAHNEIVTGATAAADGMVVKGQGDGFMLAFRSARRALTAARAIQRGIGEIFNDPGSPIRIRVGVHTGEILREADDFFGQTVNYAARVAAAAGTTRSWSRASSATSWVVGVRVRRATRGRTPRGPRAATGYTRSTGALW